MQYPEEKWVVPEGYRGAPYLVKDQDGNTKCVTCQLCEFVCPPKAIKITPPGPAGQLADRPNAEKMPKEFEINMLRCIFCGFCQEVCPEEAIFLQKDYSLTGTSRAEMIYNKEKLLALGGVHAGVQKWKHKAGRGEGAGKFSGEGLRHATSNGNCRDILFYVFAFLTLLCGVLVVANPFSRNPVTSAMFLVLTIISMAGLFVLLHAFFLAAVQVLVYAGAVMVLFLFVIMLLDLKEEERRKVKKLGLVAGLISVGAIVAIFVKLAARDAARQGLARADRRRRHRHARQDAVHELPAAV